MRNIPINHWSYGTWSFSNQKCRIVDIVFNIKLNHFAYYKHNKYSQYKIKATYEKIVSLISSSSSGVKEVALLVFQAFLIGGLGRLFSKLST